MIEFNRFKRITGIKLYVVVESTILLISIVMNLANEQDSIEFIDVMESILDFLDGEMIQEIISVYADKGCDVKQFKNYLRNYGIRCCMSYKNNSKFTR